MSKEKNLSEKVMARIKKEKVKMRPRIYFILGSLLLGMGLVGAIILSIFFTNLVLFRLKVHAPFAYLYFGPLGFGAFLANLPWLFILLTLTVILGGVFLLRRYEVSYKKSFLGLVIILVTAILIFAVLLNRLNFNERIRRSRRFDPLYHHQFFGRDWLMAKILGIGDQELLVVTSSGKEVKLIYDEKVFLPRSEFFVGEEIRAVGDWQDGNNFKAEGIISRRIFNEKVKSLRHPDEPRP